MNGATDAVLKLQVHLRHRILREHGRVRDVPDGGGLDHVADGEALDRLVLGRAARAVDASDRFYVAAAGLVASTVERGDWVSYEEQVVGRVVEGPGPREGSLGDRLRWRGTYLEARFLTILASGMRDYGGENLRD